jgi:hypothetical protein
LEENAGERREGRKGIKGYIIDEFPIEFATSMTLVMYLNVYFL